MRQRIQDRFLNVILISLDGGAIRHRVIHAVGLREAGSDAPLIGRRMALSTTPLVIQLFTQLDRRHRVHLDDFVGEPLLEVRLFMHINPGDHFRVVPTTVFRAIQVERLALFRCPRRVEPQIVVATRQNILLHAEDGDEQAVDHVLRTHDQLDVPIARNVEFRADNAVGVDERPTPLLGDHLDVVGVIGGGSHVDEAIDPHDEHHDDDERWQNRPGQFKWVMVRRGEFGLMPLPPSIFDQEGDQDRHDQHEEEQGHPIDKRPSAIHRLGHRRCILGKPEATGLGRGNCRKKLCNHYQSAQNQEAISQSPNESVCLSR